MTAVVLANAIGIESRKRSLFDCLGVLAHGLRIRGH
jgi:hypothetical protein